MKETQEQKKERVEAYLQRALQQMVMAIRMTEEGKHDLAKLRYANAELQLRRAAIWERKRFDD